MHACLAAGMEGEWESPLKFDRVEEEGTFGAGLRASLDESLGVLGEIEGLLDKVLSFVLGVGGHFL